jgi:hypothetical protein
VLRAATSYVGVFFFKIDGQPNLLSSIFIFWSQSHAL